VVELLPVTIVYSYYIVVLAIGVWAYRRYRPSTLDAWTHGGGFARTLLQTILLAGTQYSALTFMGMIGYGYLYGSGWIVVSPIYTMGATALLFLLFYARIWKIFKKFGWITLGQITSGVYGRAVGTFIGLVTAIALLPYMQIQLMGAGYLAEVCSYGLLPFWVGAALSYAVVGAYVILGGVISVAYTTLLQGILMLGFIGIVPFVSHFLVGGPGEVFTKLAAMYPTKVVLPDLYAPWGPIFQFTFIASWMGWFFHPSIFTRATTARDPATLRRTVGLYFITWLVVITNFIFASSLILVTYPEQAAIADKLWIKFIAEHWPPVVLGITGAAGLAALQSSLDSQSQALSSEFAIDIFRVLIPGKLSKKAELMLVRCLVLVFLAVGFVLALVSPVYLMFLGEFTTAIAVQAMPGFLGAVIPIRFFNKYAVAAGLAGGLLASALASKYFFPIPYLWFGFVGLMVNFAIVFVGSAITKRGRPSEEIIKAIKEVAW
jgi:SSS family solute:Na+ symporter